MVISVTEKNKAGERTECASELISILNRVTFEQNLEDGKGASQVDARGRTFQTERTASTEASGSSLLREFGAKQSRMSWETLQTSSGRAQDCAEQSGPLWGHGL